MYGLAYNAFTMKCLHVTAKSAVNIEELLNVNLPEPYRGASLLEAGAVWLGKRRCLPRQRLEAGDTVRVYLRAAQGTPHAISTDDLLFQDDRVLVVYKKAGLPVQGDPASQQNHLSHGVWLYLGASPHWHPAPITRLDQPVSGLVLFGACPDSEKALFALMREGKVFKWYRTRLSGHPAPGCRLVDLPLVHSGRFIRVDAAGKSAKTLFVPLDSRQDSQDYSAFPLTGRRHQIRVHAARALAPILGDTLYGGPKLTQAGIALCCVGLNFELDHRRYRIRLPSELCIF